MKVLSKITSFLIFLSVFPEISVNLSFFLTFFDIKFVNSFF